MQNTCLTELPILHSLTWWIQGLSRTCGMKFKDFRAPVLFSSTFKALNLGEKNSSTFKDAWEPWISSPAEGVIILIGDMHVCRACVHPNRWMDEALMIDWLHSAADRMASVHNAQSPFLHAHLRKNSVHYTQNFILIIQDSIFLQCFDIVGWVIWPVKTCPQYDL